MNFFNLPKTLSAFSYFIDDPFVIFEQENFLDKKIYEDLNSSFPSEIFFDAKHEKGNKIFLNNTNKSFLKFLEENQSWQNFYNHLNTKSFINQFYHLINIELKKIERRKNINQIIFEKDYKQNIYSKLKKKIYKLFNYTTVRIGFEFSIIKSNCFIPPHCDTDNKLLSLMLYFPPINNLSQEHENLGTNFYKSKDVNSNNKMNNWFSEMLDKDTTIEFHRNYISFYKSKFSGNKLVGFIKNNKSWHDVSAFTNPSYERRSVNINIYLV